MRTPVLVVVNPAAGGGRARRIWRRLRERGLVPGDWEGVETRGLHHARELARTAASRGDDRVVVVGGDGTVSAVASGLVGSSCALAIIPGGSGNDFGRALGVPVAPAAAARLAATGVARPVDVGEIRFDRDRGYFVNVASFGFDAHVAQHAQASCLRFGGTFRYLVGMLRTLRRLRPSRVQIDLDGRQLERSVLLLAVANGACYGGGLRIAPDARLDDGYLDLCVVRGLSPAAVLGLLPRVYWGGHRHHPGVELLRCQRAQVWGPAGLPGQADGERLPALPATFSLRPSALRCVAPSAP